MNKKTLIVGATTNPNRYAYLAAERLARHQQDFIPIGIKKGEVLGQSIVDLKDKPALENIHTVTMYLGAKNQKEWEDYILSLHPKRIIFNPGAENPSLENKASEMGIEALQACTLVMLGSGQY